MFDINPIVFYAAIYMGILYKFWYISIPIGLLFGFLALKVIKKTFSKILLSIIAAGLLIPPILAALIFLAIYIMYLNH
ncbi:hypothetical protein [Xenorhabdus sp. KJ12.1]|uniref:hypothetical protein n=1 Tax=Xenorhabdus sp. KJ12.1 TaxID=1851571 RepID=UPI000C055903|nr:hypothetical protein [Xenorhabdus sp. KJ12.1]PHM70379.1 hypothetical protein Xekj_02007 [Xenorhabdus sp. KJ12.1]